MSKIFHVKWSDDNGEEEFGVFVSAPSEEKAQEIAETHLKEEDKFDFEEDHEYAEEFKVNVTDVTDNKVLGSYFHFVC